MEKNRVVVMTGRLRCFTMEIVRFVDMLRERNKQYGTIKFVDIGSPEYTLEENQGLDYETAMGRIHAILSDGTVVKDVEVDYRKGGGGVYGALKPYD